jgi:sugar lactone lactonase YvrE
VIDEKRNVLYVSQSVVSAPGIWRFDLTTGEGEMWYSDNLEFANGLALSQDGSTLYVAETFGSRVSTIHIHEDGSPAKANVLIEVPGFPDGLILHQTDLYITNYEPSVIYRASLKGKTVELEKYVEDRTAHALAHPTNGVVYNNVLYIANLGRWHISFIPLDR